MNPHFDMHEDIQGTYRHLVMGHHVKPAVESHAVGQGAASELAHQHEALHPAREVVVMGRRAMENISVHLANEHRINPDSLPFESHHIRHMMAHTYGEWRAGQEHVHEHPEHSS
jgi:hypothetical protein